MTVIPTLRCADAKAMIQFMTDGLGFEAALVVEREDGQVQHAQLVRGDGMVMLGSESSETNSWDLGHASIYLPVATDAEVTDIYDQAIVAGGSSVSAPEAQDYGGVNATVRDPEGNFWSIGSYQP